MLLIARHRIDDPVRPHFLRVFVQDGHARLYARLYDYRLDADVFAAHHLERNEKGRDHARDDRALHIGQLQFLEGKEAFQEHGVFVDGLLEHRAEPPMVDERVVPVDAEDHVRIPDIDDEKRVRN